MRKAMIAILLVSAQAAEAQTETSNTNQVTKERSPVFVQPSLGLRKVVTAGDAILNQSNVSWVEAASIIGEYNSPLQISNKFTLNSDNIFKAEISSAAFKACVTTPVGDRNGFPCLLDDDGDGVFDRVAGSSISKAHPIGTPVAYRRLEPVPVPLLASGFTRTLLYQGVTAGTLTLGYREFKDDLARPAFDETLNIPLSNQFPQKFAVKGAIFTVYKIDGLGIDYSIDSYGNFAKSP